MLSYRNELNDIKLEKSHLLEMKESLKKSIKETKEAQKRLDYLLKNNFNFKKK